MNGLLTGQSDNACDPSNYETNLAMNLEVADLINSKKGNAYVARARHKGLWTKLQQDHEKQQLRSST